MRHGRPKRHHIAKTPYANPKQSGMCATIESADPGIDVESVRVRLSEGKVTEYVWIHPFEKTADGYKGKANSVPSQLKKLVVGGQVSFKREDIVDWTYFEIKPRRMHGNFTTCVQLAKAPASEVEALKKAYGLDCSKNR